MRPLHIFLVGTPQDQPEILSLGYQLTLRVPAISLQNLPYSYLLNKFIEIQSQSECYLFVVLSKHLKIDPFLNKVLQKISQNKHKVVFYPLSISNKYHRATSWTELVKVIERTRDTLVKKYPKVNVYLLNSENIKFKQGMSKLYSKFLNNQNVRFHNIGKPEELNKLFTIRNQASFLIISDREISLLRNIKKIANIFTILFSSERRNNAAEVDFTTTKIQQIEVKILESIRNASQFTSHSRPGSALSTNSNDSKDNFSKNKLPATKIESNVQNKFVSSQINNTRLVIIDCGDQMFRKMYQKLALSIVPTIVYKIPSFANENKPTIILTTLSLKNQVIKTCPNFPCIFFYSQQTLQRIQPSSLSNIFITNNPAQVQQHLFNKGISFIKQSSPKKEQKSVKFADQTDKGKDLISSFSDSSLLGSNSRIIRNINKNKKRKPNQQPKKIINDYNFSQTQSKSKSLQNVFIGSLSMPIISNSNPQFIPETKLDIKHKPSKQFKIQRTVNIQTNPRPFSASPGTHLIQNIKNFQPKITQSQSSSSLFCNAPIALNAPQKFYKRGTSASTSNNLHQRMGSNSQQKTNGKLLMNKRTNSNQYAIKTKQNTTNIVYNLQRNPYYNTSPLQIPKQKVEFKANGIFKTQRNTQSSPSIIDKISPLTSTLNQDQIIYRQKGIFTTQKGNLFLVPHTRQILIQKIKKVATKNDDLAIYKTQSSLELVHYQNYKLVIVFKSHDRQQISLNQYIPNIYVAMIGSQPSKNNKQIVVEDVGELPRIIDLINNPKPINFSFFPANSQPKNPSYLTQTNDKPIVLYPSFTMQNIFSVLVRRLCEQIAPVPYSSRQSLLKQVGSFSKCPVIVILLKTQNSLIGRIKTMCANINILVYGSSSEYEYDPQIKIVNNVNDLLAEVQFICRT